LTAFAICVSDHVQFILTHDPKAIFSFASLQGEVANKILLSHQLDNQQMNSFVLLENGEVYTRSTAALRVAKQMSGIWKLLYVFILVPPFIRDAVYDWIARNRYHWFGKHGNLLYTKAWVEGKIFRLALHQSIHNL